MKLVVDFSKEPAAQDMIVLIGKEKGLTPPEAINLSVCPEIYRRIIKTGWGSIALPIWGHDDPEREWEVLENPIVDVELEERQIKAIQQLQQTEEVELETAVAYFLLFEMEAMGYHI